VQRDGVLPAAMYRVPPGCCRAGHSRAHRPDAARAQHRKTAALLVYESPSADYLRVAREACALPAVDDVAIPAASRPAG
jgi:hypothetical protein